MKAFTKTERKTESNPILDRYLTEIGKFEVLTPDEEFELVLNAKKGDKEAFDKLIKHNLRFVVTVAKKYQNQGAPLVDLINEGNKGLIKAFSRFDPTRGFKFISQAVWWIREAMLSFLRDEVRVVRLPGNTVGEVQRYLDISDALSKRQERVPTIDEIAGGIGLSVKKTANVVGYSQWNVSGDSLASEDTDETIFDLILVSNEPHYMVDQSLKRDLNRLFFRLTEREELILKMFYGIGYPDEYTPQHIADKLGIGHTRVLQILRNAEKKLQTRECKKLLVKYVN